MSMEIVSVARPRDGVAHLALNRSSARNALSGALIAQLGECVAEAVRDPAVRCIVMTGDGRTFSAGADIKEMSANGMDALEVPERAVGWSTIENCPKPLIAAVRGYAFGGGNELAMLADFILAADDARFGQPEINIGIFPGDGATQRLTRLVGRGLAMQMILSGQPIDAHAALRAGLVTEIHPAEQLYERAFDIAQVIASKPPVSLRLAKDAVRAVDAMPLSAGLVYERRLLAFAFTTKDQKEGMRAFIEKREPMFDGR
ncbi:enoyl-CoA hydratase/isomerase family protein [Ramlibacter sp.]|uniref:enoyl-CoA hydratase/isomerase family protein n=1 Tax=Ramlibacter sp. TaxID=1917967 RepID=UPI003D12B7BA